MNVVELAPEMPVGFRDGTPEDERFIYSSWLRSHLRTGDWPRRLGIAPPREQPGEEHAFGGYRPYFGLQKKVIARLLERSKVLVACNPTPGKEWQILGYIVYEPGVLHWVFVKDPFRWDPAATDHPRLGTALVAQAFEPIVRDDIVAPLKERICHPIQCSHWTKAAERLRSTWWLVYRPFLLEEQ